MKKQLLKRLLAFVVMMFSISFLNAQCPGNKVQMFKSTRSGGCLSKCVPQSQVQKYTNQGWSFFCVVVYTVKTKRQVQKIRPAETLTGEKRLSKKADVMVVSKK